MFFNEDTRAVVLHLAGFDPATIPDDQLPAKLGEIVRAIEITQRETLDCSLQVSLARTLGDLAHNFPNEFNQSHSDALQSIGQKESPMLIGAALRELVLRREGFDPTLLTEDELKARLPEIIRAVAENQEESIAGRRYVERVAMRAIAGSAYIPNPGILRDESWEMKTNLNQSARDPNSVFDSVIPF